MGRFGTHSIQGGCRWDEFVLLGRSCNSTENSARGRGKEMGKGIQPNDADALPQTHRRIVLENKFSLKGAAKC